jgi:hypothetical protein
MKTMTATLFLSFAMLGCGGLSQIESRVIDGVDRYCTTVDEEDRAAFRREVNAVLEEKGHGIKVFCEGDRRVYRMGKN